MNFSVTSLLKDDEKKSLAPPPPAVVLADGKPTPPGDLVNLLLVDDDTRNLDVLESFLASPDRHLVRAQTAEQTLMALIERDFAAIVLDIQMPDMSGFELAKLIKQRKRNQHIPIIFLTAFFHEDKDVLSGYDIGAVDYLTKPVNTQILQSKVNVFVDLFRASRALAATNSHLNHEIVQRQEAEEALRRANVELEARVEQRTADLLRANRELRESEERYRLILENALEYAIFTVDTNGLVTTWNPGAERVLGFEEQEILGHRLDLIFTPEDRQHGLLELELSRALAEGRAQSESWHLRKDGSPFWASGLLMSLKREDGRHLGFLKILRDRTIQKRVEQHLREADILRASEHEQRRISHDLHDGLGQQLAGISCLSDGLKKDLASKSSPYAADAAKISDLLNQAVAQTRSLARGLQPVESEPYGLVAALQELAGSVGQLFKVSCRFDCPEPVLIEDNAVATHLFRIAQEAVTNAYKHGRAENIQIQLSSASGRITLAIRDDGTGLPESPLKSKGMGLRIMEDRASLIDSTLVIQNITGGGVELTCTLEISAAPKTVE